MGNHDVWLFNRDVRFIHPRDDLRTTEPSLDADDRLIKAKQNVSRGDLLSEKAGPFETFAEPNL